MLSEFSNSAAISMQLLLSIVTFLTLLFGTLSPAQGASPAKRSKPPLPSKAQILSAHMALNSVLPSESLLTACKRGNFKQFAQALNLNKSTIQPTKGEFESSDQFATRLANIKDLMEKHPKFVCLDLLDEDTVEFQYIADFQHFLGSMPAQNLVFSTSRFLRNYRSTNAFGVPVNVKATLENHFWLDLLSRDLKSSCLDIYPASGNKYFFKVPVPLQDASRLKNGGKMVILFTLSYPFVSEAFEDGEPTLDDPFDVSVHTLKVTGVPNSMHIIDDTGKPVWSCSLN